MSRHTREDSGSAGRFPLGIRLGVLALLVLASAVLFSSLLPAQWRAAWYVRLPRAGIVLLALFFLFERTFSMQLHTKILLGLVLGIAAGVLARSAIADIQPIGTAFIRLIRMIVVPLVLASIAVGVASLRDLRKLGRIGGKTIVFYLTTTAIAITIGLVVANLLRPGTGLDPETSRRLLDNYQGEVTSRIEDSQGKPGYIEMLLEIIPVNPFESFTGAKMLQIIFFAIFLGVGLTLLTEERSRPVTAFLDGVSEAMIKIIHVVMLVAPYGVFALIAAIVGQFGAGILMTLLKYALAVLVGLTVHLFFTYGGMIRVFTPMRPLRFFKAMRPAQLIAFSSSSSAATLPVTMECCEDGVGVSKEVASFVLPLGATMNMDGTALYQGVAAVFIAQVYGIPLTLGDQLTVVLTATLASIGTAAVPGVGIILLTLVLQSINVPIEGIALILGVDRILDMCRTTVNITGDAACATVVASSEGALSDPLDVESRPMSSSGKS